MDPPLITPPNEFVALPRIPSACTGLLNRISDAAWERRFNIATAGRIEARHDDAVRYEPIPYYVMFRVFDHLRLHPEDTVVDVGSGMGRIACIAASYPVRQVVGLELERDLHEAAERNVARARGLVAPIRLHCLSAANYDFQHSTVIVFFNPFGPPTMRHVLARIESSLRVQPRPVRIAYINATCGHLLSAEPWLQVDGWWLMSAWSRIKTPVHFYRTRLPMPPPQTRASVAHAAAMAAH